MNEEALRLDNQICFHLYKAHRTMTRIYQPVLETLNITYPQYVTMLVLWEFESIDFKNLGKRLDLKTGTLTPIIKRLETLGFLYREKNLEDNRRIWVKITEEGRTLKENALKIPEFLMNYLNIDMDQYLKYIGLLDELGAILAQAETKQKKEV